MAKQRQVGDYRHDARRKNNPPAGIGPTYEVKERRTTHYSYDPHLDPQLMWAGKAEHTSFEVDVVSLHIHERISTRAILEAVKKPEPQLDLFGETPLRPDQQIEFYQHEVGWANRLILGDSLLVMNSLLVKEGMAGKVQMIYLDPPYGIKYSSNFQPRIDRRDVKDRDEDLTHEPEQIKAYRDTWKLGIHSYLTYLRDRLLLCRELLHESGSIFVQINDENLHLVRCLLDEVFGRENFCGIIPFSKTGGLAAKLLDSVLDYLIWYSKDKRYIKYHSLYLLRRPGAKGATGYTLIEDPDGLSYRNLTKQEMADISSVPSGWKIFDGTPLISQGYSEKTWFEFLFQGKVYTPPRNRHWSTTRDGLRRLKEANRIVQIGNRVEFKRYFDDFPFAKLTNIWLGTGERGFTGEKLYAVQTATEVIERCILMTTDPGDLVFDPTCVREGTRVWVMDPSAIPPQARGQSPLLSPRRRGDRKSPSPFTGRVREGVYSLRPIETIQPGELVLGHDGRPHRVLRTIRRVYKGLMIGLQHQGAEATLWLTADHRVLAKRRPRTLGGKGNWSGVPPAHWERSRQLRRHMTPPERRLWQALRRRSLGVKFRRQHPIGPYIADFYSREAQLVVEVDGSLAHGTEEAIQYDRARDAFLESLGLRVLRIPASEVEHNLEGVCHLIQSAVEEIRTAESAEWIEAAELQVGDIVFFGPQRTGVRITHIAEEYTEEEVYDLEVEGVHSFLTEVCVVHNCGSGTTAYCAEKWGRRWITCDTSRVALAIARQRLMTAKFDYYELKDPERGPAGGFIYETVPHITLESIAHNTEIDEIAAKYQPQIEEALAELNRAMGKEWKEWEVPREVQEDWPAEAKEAHKRFWSLKRKKRQEIDESIQRNAPQETLYDRPKVKRGVVRVSGPFTVEAIPVPVVEDPSKAPIPPFEEEEARARISDRGGNYLTTMINLLRQQGGVLFPGGRKMELENLRPLNLGMLHAEAETRQNGKVLRVALSFGPQYGPVTAFQVQEAIPTARMNAYDVLIFAGFSFDPEAQALIQKVPVAGLQVHFANIAPDVLVGDLLKTTRASQIFTVYGQPDVALHPQKDGTYVVELRGVDIYDPLTGEVQSTRGEDVAAWFLDTDYDGMTFHICQAFFPGDNRAWEKLQRALKAQIDPEAFEKMRGTRSFPFKPGENGQIAVKVIDFRGNEVVKVVPLR